MPKHSLPAVQALFAGPQPAREPLLFSWRLVRRKKRPFLLLPEHSSAAPVGLELYSAQRPLARLGRSLIPLLLRTPVGRIFGRVTIEADAASEWVRFLANQAGLSPGQLRAPAIKFGGVAGRSSRLAMLLCDAGGHPIRVIKVGLNARGRAETEREAEMLSRLPKDVIGCTGITGRFSSPALSAFATAYFPGAPLENDLGVERLFHDWLHDTRPELIRNLASWRELESVAAGAGLPQWPAVREVLAGHAVRPAIFHGDFAPWNVRMTNLENIRAFDWERGHLRGLPAWDWFHFIVQTSILVKRSSPERVAAELEQLVLSPRFQSYAREAGILPVIEPLLLAYLLHQKLVIQPREGGELTNRLFLLLWTRWQFKAKGGDPASAPPAGRGLTFTEQITSAVASVANLFWEPSLSPEIAPPFSAQLRRYWPALLAAGLWSAGALALRGLASPLLSFAPFFLVPGVVLALKTDRRLASIAALLGAAAGPLERFFRLRGSITVPVVCWNILMRLLVFQLVVILLDRVRKQSLYHPVHRPHHRPGAIQAISGNWAVVLVSSLFLALVMVVDVKTSRYLAFLPLYLLPCMVLTLAANWRWGTVAALVASSIGPLLQRFDDPGYGAPAVLFWNILMRLVIFETVVILLDRIRRKNILFNSGKPH